MVSDIRKNFFILSAENQMKSQEYSDVGDVINEINTAIKEMVPFSLVRINDGEGRLLGARDVIDDNEVLSILKTWFGDKATSIEDKEVGYIKDELIDSVRQADILGIPKKFSHRKNAASVAAAVFSIPPEKWHHISKGASFLTHAAIPPLSA